MIEFLRKIWARIESASMARGRANVRYYLLQFDGRKLAELGFSRELLEQGDAAWPWRIAVDESPVSERRAAGERELAGAALGDDDLRRAA